LRVFVWLLEPRLFFQRLPTVLCDGRASHLLSFFVFTRGLTHYFPSSLARQLVHFFSAVSLLPGLFSFSRRAGGRSPLPASPQSLRIFPPSDAGGRYRVSLSPYEASAVSQSRTGLSPSDVERRLIVYDAPLRGWT